MKINYTPQVIRSVKNYKKQVSKTASSKPKSMKSDKIEISSSAKQFQVAFSELKKMPEVREAKVAELKEQFQNGSYKIDSEKIAEVILGY